MKPAPVIVNAAAVCLLAVVVIGSFLVAGGALSGIMDDSGSDGSDASKDGEAGASGLQAVVHDVNGTEYALPLSDDGRVDVVTASGENAVVVEDGEAYMLYADCEGQDCVRQGRISKVGEQIICLPHELWVEIAVRNAADDAGDAGDAFDEFDILSR